MLTAAPCFQALFFFLTFTLRLVLSIPIPKEVAPTQRTTSASAAYARLKRLDEDITAVLPQIGIISGGADADPKYVVYSLTSAINSAQSHAHNPISFTSGAPSKKDITQLANVVISKVWKAYQGLPTAEITNFSSRFARVHPSDGGMRNEVQQSIGSRDWAQLIPRQLWTIIITVMSLLGDEPRA